LVPDSITLALLRNAMQQSAKGGQTKFLIDGYPRSLEQAKMFEAQVAPVSFVLYLHASDQESP
jgi:UMP-CMP kinase